MVCRSLLRFIKVFISDMSLHGHFFVCWPVILCSSVPATESRQLYPLYPHIYVCLQVSSYKMQPFVIRPAQKDTITGSSAVYVHLVPACTWKSSTSRKINSSRCPAFNARMLNEVINTMSYHTLRNRNITCDPVVVIHWWTWMPLRGQ